MNKVSPWKHLKKRFQISLKCNLELDLMSREKPPNANIQIVAGRWGGMHNIWQFKNAMQQPIAKREKYLLILTHSSSLSYFFSFSLSLSFSSFLSFYCLILFYVLLSLSTQLSMCLVYLEQVLYQFSISSFRSHFLSVLYHFSIYLCLFIS